MKALLERLAKAAPKQWGLQHLTEREYRLNCSDGSGMYIIIQAEGKDAANAAAIIYLLDWLESKRYEYLRLTRLQTDDRYYLFLYGPDSDICTISTDGATRLEAVIKAVIQVLKHGAAS